MERETITIRLAGKHAGLEAVMDGDPEASFWLGFQSGQWEHILRALESVLISWNFRGRDGAELSPDYEGLKRVPTTRLKALCDTYGAQLGAELPNQ